MIAVDTSTLMAIVLGEPDADACIAVLEAETDLMISAGTVAEALIVAARRNVADEMERLIDGLGFEIVSVTSASARRIAQARAPFRENRCDLIGIFFSDEIIELCLGLEERSIQGRRAAVMRMEMELTIRRQYPVLTLSQERKDGISQVCWQQYRRGSLAASDQKVPAAGVDCI